MCDCADIPGRRGAAGAIRAARLTCAIGLAACVVCAAAAGPARRAATGPASAPATSAVPAATTLPAEAPSGARATPDGWFAPRPQVKRPPLPAKVTRAFVLPIREPITPKTYDALKRKVVRCRAAGAELVILDMDTWGGDAMAALDISRLLKSELADIRSACFVRTRAVSAGALIALACHEIVMTEIGTFGDCAPMSVTGELEGVQREKIETVLRAEFEESAQRSGYNVALSVSMVSHDLEVWLVRHKRRGELQYVLATDFRGRVEVPPGLSDVKSNPAAEWDLLRIVVPEGKLLTMSPARAVEYGFAAAVVPSPRDDPLAGLREHYGMPGEPVAFEDTWSEQLVEFLNSPVVAGFLLFVGLLCAYVEINTPGFGVAGAVAIACVAVLLGSRYLTGLAQWWEIALFVLGVVLLVVEIFITPGFGVLGAAGLVCCAVGLLAMIVPNAPDKLPLPTTNLDWRVFKTGLLAMFLGFVGAVVAAAVLARYLPKMPLAGRLVLAPPAGVASVAESSPIRAIAVGQVGTVVSPCRPVGQVRFGEQLVDAVADGEFIAPGGKVKVIRNEGNRVVVTGCRA